MRFSDDKIVLSKAHVLKKEVKDMKRIGLLLLVLSVFGTMLMAGCNIEKKPTSGAQRAAPVVPKK